MTYRVLNLDDHLELVSAAESLERDRFNLDADDSAQAQNPRLDRYAAINGSNRVVGILFLTIGRGDTVYINTLATARDMESRGIGHLLLSHAEDVARSLHATRLWLKIDKKFNSNTQAPARLVCFYHNAGYYPVKDPEKYRVFTGDHIVMTKNI